MSKKNFAFDAIRESIIAGKWRPDVTKSENELAQQLGVSRSPIRDALAALAQEGLVEQIPQVGVRVKELTNDDYRELFKVRELVEPLAARELAACFSGRAYDVLDHFLQEMGRFAEEGAVAKFLEADTEFHSQTAALANMPFLESILRQIGNRVCMYGYISTPSPERMREVVIEHKQILDAVSRRDPQKASTAAVAHLEQTKIRLGVKKA